MFLSRNRSETGRHPSPASDSSRPTSYLLNGTDSHDFWQKWTMPDWRQSKYFPTRLSDRVWLVIICTFPFSRRPPFRFPCSLGRMWYEKFKSWLRIMMNDFLIVTGNLEVELELKKTHQHLMSLLVLHLTFAAGSYQQKLARMTVFHARRQQKVRLTLSRIDPFYWTGWFDCCQPEQIKSFDDFSILLWSPFYGI